MAMTNRSPMRVLIRPPPIPSTHSSSPPLQPPPTTYQTRPPLAPPPPNRPSSPSQKGGVVVVGFIGRRQADVCQLINRIIDSNVFGSGNGDRVFGLEKGEISEEVKEWFKCRRISYYHEEENGILYLQFSSTRCPVMEGVLEVQSGSDSVLEEREFGDLRGMLFMFSVCHVIIFMQEGSRFDIQILKKFRVLQAAKIAMSPFVRSQTLQPLTPRSHPSSSSQTFPSGVSAKNRSPGKNGSINNRNGSAITLMSGLGSYTSLFPGQCTPVTLFVFLDDFSDCNPNSNTEELAETSGLNQSSSLNSSARPSLPVKGSGPVVVLSRPVIKSEGGFRKKSQSSLEAQIRFSIKKCRTLTGSETGHAGSRSGGVPNSAPLFSLDASKAVALVDRPSNQRGESLEFATGIVENVLNGISASDSLLLESHCQNANREDILSVKEFINRQSDILRGRGGMVSNANSVSAAGVGMVAVAAAAAAAASSASGKTFNTPELPSLEIWLSSSQLILHGLLSAKRGSIDESEIIKRKPRQRNNLPPAVEGDALKGTDPLEAAVFYLDSGRELNTNFSTLWCQRALPVAKDVYLNNLPACYPTSQHEAHLEKALCAFKSMVKGPAVQLCLKKLEDECTSIWSSGRQLCDAVSLTGKSCIHRRHDVEAGGLLSRDDIKPHSSGFVFLHACACGRSRKLRSDPFDFETANSIFICYPDCDRILPSLQLPQGNTKDPIQASSWSLVRVGSARYYQPSKGLLQSGFCTTEKFLLKWKIYLEKHKNPCSSPRSALLGDSTNGLSSKPEAEPIGKPNVGKTDADKLYPGEILGEVEFHRKTSSDNIRSGNKRISSGSGLHNFTMRKPFSEVVAGLAATDSGFPPLQSKKLPSLGSEKVLKQNHAAKSGTEQGQETTDHQGSRMVEDTSARHENVDGNENRDGYPFLKIGNNVVPVTMTSFEKINLSTSLKHVVVYVGFEHECPRGHRFILTPDHLSGLGSTYALPEESHLRSSVDNSDHKVADHPRLGKNGGHKNHRNSNRVISTAVSKVRSSGKPKEVAMNGKQCLDGMIKLRQSVKEQNGVQPLGDSMKDIEGSLQSISLDDGDSAFSLLNRNLPVYLNCPHCQKCKSMLDPPKAKFAGTISQLQRIFLVTPPFPVILATCPVIQFEASSLPPSVEDREQKLQFSLGCPVILPPDSFLSLRLPFVYGVQLEDGNLFPLKPFENQPELTAWITKSTTLQVMSKGSSLDDIITGQN